MEAGITRGWEAVMERGARNYAWVPRLEIFSRRVISAFGLHYRLPFVRSGFSWRVISRFALHYRLPFVRSGFGRRVIPASGLHYRLPFSTPNSSLLTPN